MRLSERVPAHKLYRRLAEVENRTFLYDETRALYRHTGQPSLDPVVFCKLMLVGRLENLVSDRRLVEHCALRRDVLLFLGCEVDEALPWHSTVRRTRQLFPAAVFEHLFDHIFGQCVAQGLVAGDRQAVDPAPVKANAPLDGLCEKQPLEAFASPLVVAGQPPPCPSCRTRRHCSRPRPINCAAKPLGKPSAKPNRGPWGAARKIPLGEQ